MEISFDLPMLPGNPFDFTENDIRVSIAARGNSLSVPAFFDGGIRWQARFTPRIPGAYKVTGITRNGKPIDAAGLTSKDAVVAKVVKPGFVGRDPKNPTRLIHADGSGYYPVGHNVAWASGSLTIPGALTKMGAAGENWSRVWMCHWSQTNLDWGQPGGRLSLEIARTWDSIVSTAEKQGIYFQMTLQHHGPYSSNVNSNWGENPWNAKNGGFLSAPEEFFVNPRAIALTKLKYRYILARWGYSPSVLAWELFNEVEWCDGTRKNPASVAAWHKEMAAFLRSNDAHMHLLTTSSDLRIPGLYDAMDYVQPHRYAPDPISAALSIRAPTDKPLFYGEVGPSGDLTADDGRYLRDILWASLMSGASGAAQYWAWDNIDNRNLYSIVGSAAAFARESGLAKKTDLKPAVVNVKTDGVGGEATLGLGGGWGTAAKTRFTLAPDGTAAGIERAPSFLQGDGHREMFPFAEFDVTFDQPGSVAVHLGNAAKAGATLRILIDGKLAAERLFPAGERDTPINASMDAKIPAGAHVVRIENAGADWVTLTRLVFAPYGPALRVLGKKGSDSALLYIKAPTGKAGIVGTITLPDCSPGRWEATLWDVKAGKPQGKRLVAVGRDGALILQTPPVTESLAVHLRRL